uniref:GB1/RHD3-type G domain-containing protein n=1 Tax=Elaeophora elaphi TaxID=1147741 RepID=A0A158Q8F4_9BILA
MSFDITAPFQAGFSTRDQIEHRHKVHPVQIIAPLSSQPNRYKFLENSLISVLGHSSIANKKIFVVIISVAGVFRKGKSFLLNIFLDYLYSLQKSQQNDTTLEWLLDDSQLGGFHWRSGMKRDTAGIWIWGEPIMIEAANGETYAVVLMDTQGTVDNAALSYQMSSTIFALSTLFSSMQVYNIVETILEDSLANLSLFVEYGRLVSDEATNSKPPFQTIVFVIRDYKSSEECLYGFEGGMDYLKTILQETSPHQSNELKNVRKEILSCFEQTLCFLLPHPGHRVADRESFKGLVKDIKPLFKEEVKKMTAHLLNPQALQPKIVNGKTITCVIPEPQMILDTNAQLVYLEAANEAKIAYIRGMDRICLKSGMLPEKRLHEAHIKYGIIALNIFERYPKIGSNEVRSRNLSALQQNLNSELEKYKRLNREKRVTSCVSRMIACGDSVFFGMGLGSAASAAVGGAVLTLQAGMVSAGVIAIPVSLTALLAIWAYVYYKPKIRSCLHHDCHSV